MACSSFVVRQVEDIDDLSGAKPDFCVQNINLHISGGALRHGNKPSRPASRRHIIGAPATPAAGIGALRWQTHFT
jgi:hypothetical protein